MSSQASKNEIVFVNPYDTKGGASMGTYRLFSYFRQFVPSHSRLLVIVKRSSGVAGIEGLSGLFRTLFFLQSAFNKLFCWFISSQQLPVAFTFFVPLSLPAFLLFLKARGSLKLYLHSMSSGFACPLSFSLLLRRATVVKTADDWFLTGGCHYSLECDQWRHGCTSCPHMNFLGKLIVRFNWWLKRKVIAISPNFVFISPSNWLSDRYESLYPGRCFVVYNSASGLAADTPSSETFCDPLHYSCIGNFSSAKANSVALGLPVTYLRDSRKGFLKALPLIVELLEKFPIKLVLCGGDASQYLDLISSEISCFHANSCVESLGFLSPKEMKLFYSRLDFVMHFAMYDNSPNVVTESLCSGIPVIALNNAGSPEHVAMSSAGFVIDEFEQLVSVVSSICNGSVDISALKRRAIQYSAEVLSAQSMVSAYRRFLA